MNVEQQRKDRSIERHITAAITVTNFSFWACVLSIAPWGLMWWALVYVIAAVVFIAWEVWR